MMNTERIKEVFSDEAFVRSLFELETAAEVRSALQQKGVELSEEEILAFRELLVKMESGEITQEQLELWQKQAEDGELSDEALEQVSGGAIIAIALGVQVAAYIAAAVIGATAGTTTYMAVTRRW